MDGFRKKRWWRGPPARRLAVCATLALMVALPARLKAAEEGGTLNVSCEGGTVTLKARDAPAPAVFLALAKKCGLLLEGMEYIPKRPVSASLKKVTMKEAV